MKFTNGIEGPFKTTMFWNFHLAAVGRWSHFYPFDYYRDNLEQCSVCRILNFNNSIQWRYYFINKYVTLTTKLYLLHFVVIHFHFYFHSIWSNLDYSTSQPMHFYMQFGSCFDCFQWGNRTIMADQWSDHGYMGMGNQRAIWTIMTKQLFYL